MTKPKKGHSKETCSVQEETCILDKAVSFTEEWPYKNITKEQVLKAHRIFHNLMGPYPTIPPLLNDRVKKALSKCHFKLDHETVVKKPKVIESEKLNADQVKDNKMLFNRLDFKEPLPLAERRKEDRRRTRLPKNPIHALNKVQQRQAKVEELKVQDPKAAEAFLDHDAWSRAIDRAGGVAVRDDVKLLKRSMKRKEKKKEQGRKRWSRIKKKQNDEAKHRQARRRENLATRKDKKAKVKKQKTTSKKVGK